MNRTVQNLLYASDANLLEENKHTFCEGNERGALLDTSNEVFLVANAEVKVGKIHNTGRRGKQVFRTSKYLGTALTIHK